MDHGIEYIVINLLDQIIGIAIIYTPTSITLTQPTQIFDSQNRFNPNDAPVPITWTQLGVTKQEVFHHLNLSTFIDQQWVYYSFWDVPDSTPSTQPVVIYHVAYIISIRHVGKTYYAADQLDNPPYLLTSNSDY